MAAKEIRRVGMIGLGQMGRPMSRHLLAKGFEVIGYDVAPAAARKVKALGARIAKSPAEVTDRQRLWVIRFCWRLPTANAICKACCAFIAARARSGGKRSCIAAALRRRATRKVRWPRPVSPATERGCSSTLFMPEPFMPPR